MKKVWIRFLKWQERSREPGLTALMFIEGTYMNFALILFALYRSLNTLVPNAFNGLPQSSAEYGSGPALPYFSFSTLTTVGYGDITPLYPSARLVGIEIEHPRQSKIG